MNQQNLPKINVHQVMERIGSKKELYEFLCQDCSAYLPKLQSTNIYFFKQIMEGKKDYLKRSDITVAAVPQIEGLTVEDFLDYAKKRQSILAYLPDERDWLHIDKHWVCDILMSLDGAGIQQMINQAMKKRREKLEEHQNLLVEMKPEFIEALKNTLSFSTHKGRAAHLIKDTSHRKRRLRDIEEVKQEEDQFKKDKQAFFQQSKRLKLDNTVLAEELQELRHYKNMAQVLFNQGLINEDGNPIAQQPDDDHVAME